MERSRVKKFEQLRQDILNENIHNDYTNENLKHIADKLSNAGVNVEKNNTYRQSQNYIPHHQKTFNDIENNLNEYNKESVEKVSQNTKFNNDYMNDFLSEVKAYNLEKGYRSQDDTKANLLNELNIKPEIRPFGNNYKNDELIDKIENIETKFDVECDDNNEVEELSSKVEFLSNSDFDISKTMESEAIPYNHNAELENSQLQTMIYHQTQELKTDFIHQKKEIDEVNNKIDRVNLILNITLGVLVFAIIVILVFFVYQLLKINGVF